MLKTRFVVNFVANRSIRKTATTGGEVYTGRNRALATSDYVEPDGMSTVFRTAFFLGIAAVGVYSGSGLLGLGNSKSDAAGADWERVEAVGMTTQSAASSRGRGGIAQRPASDSGGWESLDMRLPSDNARTRDNLSARRFRQPLMTAKPLKTQGSVTRQPLVIQKLPAVELAASRRAALQTAIQGETRETISPPLNTADQRPAEATVAPQQVVVLPNPIAEPSLTAETNAILEVKSKVVADRTTLEPSRVPELLKVEAEFASTPSEIPSAELPDSSEAISDPQEASTPPVLPEIVDLESVETAIGRSNAIATKSGISEVDPVADFSSVIEAAEPVDTTGDVGAVEIDQRLLIQTATPSAEERAAKHIEYGKSLARRGSVFSARQELMQALRIIAESYDIRTRSRDYTDRLACGWRALQESDDFIARDAQQQMDMNLGDILETHTTQIINTERLAEISTIEAMQIYYAFAEDQILQAVGKSVVASDALFALGKLLTTAARFDASGKPQDRTKAMVMHQVALSANQDNYLSANELGVLLANNGRWHRSLDLFSRSLRSRQTAATWKNMAMAHEQISLRSEDPAERQQQAEWAGLAMQEFDRLQLAQSTSGSGRPANWATSEQFSDLAAMPEIGNAGSLGASSVRKTTAQKNVGKSLFQNVKDWF